MSRVRSADRVPREVGGWKRGSGWLLVGWSRGSSARTSFYRVTTVLILKAEVTYEGKVADTSLERVKWPNRIGWGLIGVGFVARGYRSC